MDTEAPDPQASAECEVRQLADEPETKQPPVGRSLAKTASETPVEMAPHSCQSAPEEAKTARKTTSLVPLGTLLGEAFQGRSGASRASLRVEVAVGKSSVPMPEGVAVGLESGALGVPLASDREGERGTTLTTFPMATRVGRTRTEKRDGEVRTAECETRISSTG